MSWGALKDMKFYHTTLSTPWRQSHGTHTSKRTVVMHLQTLVTSKAPQLPTLHQECLYYHRSESRIAPWKTISPMADPIGLLVLQVFLKLKRRRQWAVLRLTWITRCKTWSTSFPKWHRECMTSMPLESASQILTCLEVYFARNPQCTQTFANMSHRFFHRRDCPARPSCLVFTTLPSG